MHATRDQDRIFVAARLKPVEKTRKIELKIEHNRLLFVDADRDYQFDAIFGEDATQVSSPSIFFRLILVRSGRGVQRSGGKDRLRLFGGIQRDHLRVR